MHSASIALRAAHVHAVMLMAVGAWMLMPGVASAQHGTSPATHDTTSMPMGAMDTMPGMRKQHSPMPPEPLGIPMSRTGSGTSSLPDASPMHARHFAAGAWQLMLHYSVFSLLRSPERRRHGAPRR